jgi:hypothetical protein
MDIKELEKKVKAIHPGYTIREFIDDEAAFGFRNKVMVIGADDYLGNPMFKTEDPRLADYTIPLWCEKMKKYFDMSAEEQIEKLQKMFGY